MLSIRVASHVCCRLFSSSSINTSQMPQVIEKNNMKDIINKYENILLDCDGVLWATDHYTRFDHIAESIDKLRQLEKNVMFVTNNSMHARKAYIEKFKQLGNFEAKIEDVFAVAYVAAVYLKTHMDVTKDACYLIGGKGMKAELDEMGITNMGYGPDSDKVSDHVDDLLQQSMANNISSVLVGFDQHFSYNKLFKATSYLMNSNCLYVTTNAVEVALQIGPKQKQPLTGAILAALTAASNRSPVVLGKPHEYLMECIQIEKPNLDLSKTLMIGDSMLSDINFAHNCGIDSVLVLTGATTRDAVENAARRNQKHFIPKYILPKFNFFNKYLS